MGIRAMIGGMSNWAPEIMTALVAATESGDQQRAELLYLVMMELSAKMHFTDSTIASQMGLYARGFNGGFARRPMALPPRSDPRYGEIRQWLEGSFERAGLPLETA
jgi:dihydrodipicolinate synthase/N-acetylneuraminate lyase